MVLPSVVYRGHFLLHLLDGRDYFLNRNPPLSAMGIRGVASSVPLLFFIWGFERWSEPLGTRYAESDPAQRAEAELLHHRDYAQIPFPRANICERQICPR